MGRPGSVELSGGELVQGLHGGFLGLSGKDQLRASAGRGWTPKEPGSAEDRWAPGWQPVAVFFSETRLTMKSGRFIRWVMPQPGPKVMKAEDGAWDTGSRCTEALVWRQHVAAAQWYGRARMPLTVGSGTTGCLRPFQGSMRSELFLLFSFSALILIDMPSGVFQTLCHVWWGHHPEVLARVLVISCALKTSLAWSLLIDIHTDTNALWNPQY